jgi:ketosteroid isomerase-like protein
MIKIRAGSTGTHICSLVLAVALGFAIPAAAYSAQKTKKPKKDTDSSQPAPAVPNSDVQDIDHDIGEMLGAFQVGDVELMHKHYADTATFVSGAFEPLVMGWQNYVARYQSQRAAFQGMQLIRRNTYIFTHGDVAWASYEWEFDAMYNGQPYSLQGQTSLVFNKVGSDWLIVHNHTSQVVPAGTPSQQPAPAQNSSPSASPR